jgi:2-polyprenyl-6-methoxyphenol hydroxylase-like FAD-dependent oxidoreductase
MTNAEPTGSGELEEVYDVLIVGGGLGGLALAVGLGHLPGLNWILVEAADELRTATGTLIGVGANGLHALECLDPRIVENLK